MLRIFHRLLPALCILAAGCAQHSPSAVPDEQATELGSPLPSLDPTAVVEMEGELYARDGTIDRFAIATTDYRKVFDLFREGTVEGRPMTWRFLGAISITYKEGGTITVWLFATYHGPGAYKIAETYYRGSTDGVFVQTLRECEERSKAAKKR